MPESYLPVNTFTWIDQSDLDAVIKETQERVRRCEDNSVKNLLRNVIDPFHTAVIAWTTNGDETEVLRRMSSSSAAPCMSMAIGWFHQSILSCSPGWQLHDALYDIEHPQRRLLAEIKNKHNTMNASNQEKVIDDLNTALREKGNRIGKRIWSRSCPRHRYDIRNSWIRAVEEFSTKWMGRPSMRSQQAIPMHCRI